MNRGLEQHREQTISQLKEMLLQHNHVACVRPTGYGKTFIISRLCRDFVGRKLIIEPQTSIIEYMNYFFTVEEGLSIDTYQKLLTIDNVKDVKEYFGDSLDYIFLDEAHRVGAERWADGVRLLVKAYPNAKIIGLTATPVRSDGLDIVDEIFNGVQVEPLTLAQALLEGLMEAPVYVSALYTFENELRKHVSKVERSTRLTEDGKSKIIDELMTKKLELENINNVDRVLKKYLHKHPLVDKNMKFVVFCSDIDTLKDINEIVQDWFKIAFPTHRINIFSVHSKMNSELVSATLQKFQSIGENKTIDIILAVNMFNEGLHLENVVGALLLRKTESEILYMQQIGRVIKANAKFKPLIFDLVNNSNSVKRAYPKLLGEEVKRFREENKFIDAEVLKNIKVNIFDEISDIIKVIEKITKEANEEWTDEEIYLLKKYYPSTGARGVIQAGVERTKKAINFRASILRVKSKVVWSSEELEVLMRVYPSHGAKGVIQAGIRREEKSIISKASAIGIKLVTGWTDEELKILRNMYPNNGANGVIQAGVNKAEMTIKAKASQLGIKRAWGWTDEEIEVLRKVYPSYGIEGVIQAGVNKSEGTIKVKASALGLRRTTFWNPTEVEILKNIYPYHGALGVIQAGVNKTKSSIHTKAINLGVKMLKGKNRNGFIGGSQ